MRRKPRLVGDRREAARLGRATAADQHEEQPEDEIARRAERIGHSQRPEGLWLERNSPEACAWPAGVRVAAEVRATAEVRAVAATAAIEPSAIDGACATGGACSVPAQAAIGRVGRALTQEDHDRANAEDELMIADDVEIMSR